MNSHRFIMYTCFQTYITKYKKMTMLLIALDVRTLNVVNMGHEKDIILRKKSTVYVLDRQRV